MAQQLGYHLINFTFRNLAEEKGLDFKQICRLAEESDEIDKELDRRQVEMALEQPDCVLGSRLAIWMLSQAELKVYLTATVEQRAQRIKMREGGSFEKRLQETRLRDSLDSERYMRIYGIDNSNPDVADLIIDTSTLTAEEVAAIIIATVRQQSEPTSQKG